MAFRKINLMRDGDVSPIGHVVPHIKSDEIVDEAVRVSGYRSAKRKHSGRGVGIAQWLPLGGECHALVAVDDEGDVTVSTAMLDQGAGTHTAMRLVAAEELQVPLEKVRVATLDTSEVGPDTGIGASRGTRIFGNATRLAAAHAKDQLIDAASKELGVARDALRLSGDGAVCAASGARVSYGDIARMAEAPIQGHGFYKNFESGPEAALCVQVAEVEVDPETGQVELKQFTTRAQHRHGSQPADASSPDRRRRGDGHGLCAHGRSDDRRRQSRYDAISAKARFPRFAIFQR